MRKRPPHLRDPDRDCIARFDVPGPPVICELEKHAPEIPHQNGPTRWGDSHSVKGEPSWA